MHFSLRGSPCQAIPVLAECHLLPHSAVQQVFLYNRSNEEPQDLSHRRKEVCLHHKLLHTGEKEFVCTQCDKAFSESSKLKRHKRSHSGEKPFACFQCDRAFSRSGTLKTHKLSHTGKKPCVCNHCNKAFSLPGDLKIHMISHTVHI